jgi:hypothetical protein
LTETIFYFSHEVRTIPRTGLRGQTTALAGLPQWVVRDALAKQQLQPIPSMKSEYGRGGTVVLLLLGAHGVGEFSRRLAEPLSMFRDGEQAWLGYALFATLLLVCIWYTRDVIRAGEEEEAVIAGLAASLLFIVAVTPSLEGFHILSSFLLMLLLFGHYWRLLRDSGSPWIIFHVLVPFALVLLSGCHSYGLWQKCLILYLVAIANLRHHRLCRMSEGEPVSESNSEWFGGGGVNGRRKVYRLGAGQEWARSKTR